MDILGLYPTWYVPGIGSAWVVGIVATIHVLASHTSIGASWFFAYLETKAYREDRPELLDYIRRYGMFLLVFSYIIGSITGPGIWFSTTVASPRGISGLIHNFVWVWAAEWVYFTIEVIGVYALVYTIGRVDRKTHLKLTWAFALASWATMMIIVGILSFMMWPGNEDWYANGSSLDAFYNLNFFAQLFMRTSLMLATGAILGSIVAARMEDSAVKRTIMRTLAVGGVLGIALGALFFQWYLATLPDNAHTVLEHRLPDYFGPAIVGILAASVAYLVFIFARPHRLRAGFAAVMAVIVLVAGLWPEERARESIRKPYVAGQYIYSNQLIARDVPGKGIHGELAAVDAEGILALHPFVPDDLRTVTEANKVRAGRMVGLVMCSNCHSFEEGGLRPLPELLHHSDEPEMIQAFVEGALATGSVDYMPRIPGIDAEREALGTYLATLSGYRPDPGETLAHNARNAQVSE